ncbi:MBL fold metallo-hydrolase RNA specificity domain-containing protein [Suipraeoptans intestinalis]|uniref:MBL fold metallo-hydrolase RNA specificity domain-containing protein n=1 Tax=Suipraeoptans intestinalis TaxID=2606628 RepID=UPI0023EFA957|nr:MBL fold metallo-hydrolase [Suipraeoptans intestinalis]MDD7769642.1 MBL fold metallo-hydrolase [Suipraeoptans intestinalis]MDY3121543.1 MBL fold metallo-hydrolase [Suipraeoptans intestinalis]
MKLTCIGAAHEVTGSCHYLEACGKNILVDCGMEQGPDIYENQSLPIESKDIDYILLTHAHIDHSGLIPLQCKQGFQGEVVTTFATADLCRIMLKDSAHIQEFEAGWRNRKAKRSGGEHFEPLYTMTDAMAAIDCLSPCEYGDRIRLCEGIEIRFQDMGHLLGSSCIEVWITEEEVTKKIVFSGDVGNKNQPIIKDPTKVAEADYVVIESTYGNRLHGEDRPDYVEEFARILRETFAKKGNVVIPSFAVGRTQEILYFIREIKNRGMVPELPDFEVFVDSPLAVEATNVFHKNVKSCFDTEALQLVEAGINPLTFPGLKLSVTTEDSIAINNDRRPKVILSASGMCEAGRIRHHLKHNLWREECTVCFVGYQAAETLGRRLLEGIKEVKLFGEPVMVRARIESLKGISGHADKEGLLDWLSGFQTEVQRVIVVHGEDTVTEEFAQAVEETFGYPTYAPYSGGSLDLRTNEIVREGSMLRKQKEKPAGLKAKAAWERVIRAAGRLLEVATESRGMANKDLAKMETEISNLIQKWEKKGES